jgi:hypothetical protein
MQVAAELLDIEGKLWTRQIDWICAMGEESSVNWQWQPDEGEEGGGRHHCKKNGQPENVRKKRSGGEPAVWEQPHQPAREWPTRARSQRRPAWVRPQRRVWPR